MKEFEITCPSGLRGVMRGMIVKDEQLLMDRKVMQSGGLMSKLLSTCWIRTLEPGPYTNMNGQLDWERVLRADRFFAFLRLRIESRGSEYEFRIACGSCRRPVDSVLDLEQLDVRMFSDEVRAKLVSGAPFETTADGKLVKFRLPVGGDDRRLATLVDGSVDLVSYATRILEVEGVQTHPQLIRAWFENLDGLVADRLRDAMDVEEAGVDTMVTLICESCGVQANIPMPLEPSFFFVRKRLIPRTSANRGLQSG